jgi:hypothetical protein
MSKTKKMFIPILNTKISGKMKKNPKNQKIEKT